MRELPSIRESVVTVREDRAGDPRLVGLLRGRDGGG
jgi:hypothetical protein